MSAEVGEQTTGQAAQKPSYGALFWVGTVTSAGRSSSTVHLCWWPTTKRNGSIPSGSRRSASLRIWVNAGAYGRISALHAKRGQEAQRSEG
jgi:hypothetical protein